MTSQQAIELLRGGEEGVTKWNLWRESSPKAIAFNRRLDLRGTDFQGAVLNKANLQDVDLSGANMRNALLILADLERAVLDRTDFHRARLMGANLDGASLSGADLTKAQLTFARLSRSILSGAQLNDCDLNGALLSPMTSDGADFFGCQFAGTTISGTLRGSKGLDQAIHGAPSDLSIATLLDLAGDLPEQFLRGCGLPDHDIAYFRSRLGKPIRFYTCFISYSTRDEPFATRLHNDFQAAGIRCWKWDHDARTGRSLWGEIDLAIRKHDKLVLVASQSSLTSPAVIREIERSLQQEDDRHCRKLKGEDTDPDVLFPIRVDDYLFENWNHERKPDVIKKVVADARGWENDNAKYQKVLQRLLRDLKPA